MNYYDDIDYKENDEYGKCMFFNVLQKKQKIEV